MDRISFLPDDVVLKILSFVPTKVVVSTNLLSKRWRHLWKHVPKLEYLDPSPDTEYWRTSRFVDRFLLLHKALVLETLHLTLSRNCLSIDIETWISVAISRGVRNLQIFQHRPGSGPIRLPWSLYTCETLVALDLQPEVIIVGDVPFKICLRSLKVLVFTLVKFSSVEILHKLLSGCPVLEKLTMVRGDDNMKSFTIAVPSLLRLIAVDCRSQVPGDDVGFVIKAPSLKFLFILSRCCGFRSLVDMPDLVKAYIKLRHGDSKKFMGCLTSTKSLYFCLQPQLLVKSFVIL